MAKTPGGPNFGGGFDNLDWTTDFTAETNKLKAAALAAGGALGTLGGKAADVAGGIAKLTAASAAAAASFAVFKSIDIARHFEQLEVSIRHMAGGMEEARARMKELVDLAAKTPLTLQQTTDAFTRLSSAGFAQRQIPEMLRAIGDAASFSGKGMSDSMQHVILAFSQVKSKGHMAQEEMRQLVNAVPNLNGWKAIADAMGITIPEAMARAKAKTIDASTALNALFRAMQTQFGGGMEKQSKTLSGLLSNLEDQLTMLGKAAGDQMLPKLKELTRETTAWVESMQKAFDNGKIQAGFGVLIGELREVAKIMKEIAEGAGGLWGGLVGGMPGGADWKKEIAQKTQQELIHVRNTLADENAASQKRLDKGELLPEQRRDVVNSMIENTKKRLAIGQAIVDTTPLNARMDDQGRVFQDVPRDRNIAQAKFDLESTAERGVLKKLESMLRAMGPKDKAEINVGGFMDKLGKPWEALVGKLGELDKAVDKFKPKDLLGGNEIGLKNLAGAAFRKIELEKDIREMTAERDKPKTPQWMGIAENWKRMQSAALGGENNEAKETNKKLERANEELKDIKRGIQQMAAAQAMKAAAVFAN